MKFILLIILMTSCATSFIEQCNLRGGKFSYNQRNREQTCTLENKEVIKFKPEDRHERVRP